MAVTLCACDIVTVHVPVPLHAPLHPAKVALPEGAADRVTIVPAFTLALHAAPQLMMPAGEVEVTVPAPDPARLTVSA